MVGVKSQLLDINKTYKIFYSWIFMCKILCYLDIWYILKLLLKKNQKNSEFLKKNVFFLELLCTSLLINGLAEQHIYIFIRRNSEFIVCSKNSILVCLKVVTCNIDGFFVDQRSSLFTFFMSCSREIYHCTNFIFVLKCILFIFNKR